MKLLARLFGHSRKVKPRDCPSCNARCRPGAMFCHACGHITNYSAVCGVLSDGNVAAKLANGKTVMLKGGRRSDGPPQPVTAKGEWWADLEKMPIYEPPPQYRKATYIYGQCSEDRPQVRPTYGRFLRVS